MSNINAFVKKVFGGLGQDGIITSNATPETVAVSTTSRMFKGPQAGARFSLQIGVTTGGGAGSVATIWYSNLPNPDPTNDAHWTQDTTVGSSGNIAITSTGTQLFMLTNNFAEHIRVKLSVLVSAVSLWAFARSEGAMAPV